MGNLKELIALCEGHKIYIQTHNFPDPDAIASAFGLQKLLKHYGIGSELCYDGRIDKLSASKMLDTFGIRMQSSVGEAAFHHYENAGCAGWLGEQNRC